MMRTEPLSDFPESGEIDDWLEHIQRQETALPVIRKPKPAVDPTEPTKRCRQCARRKPVSNFAKQRRSRDGYAHYCNTCLSLLPLFRQA